MDAREILHRIADELRALAGDAVRDLLGRLPELGDEPSAAGTVLAGRLLAVHDRLPPGDELVELVRDALGDLTDGSALRLAGWRRAPGGPLGVALVLTGDGPAGGRAVLGVTPDGPVFDVVVTPGSALRLPPTANGPWTVQAEIAAPDGWDAAFGPGRPAPPVTGTATIRLERTGRLGAGPAEGPCIAVEGVTVTVTATPAAPPAVTVELRGLTAAVLPKALAGLVGADGSGPMSGGSGPVDVTARADRDTGLVFDGGSGPRIPLPLRLSVAGVRLRDTALRVALDGTEPRLALSLSLEAALPRLPLRITLADTGIDLPLLALLVPRRGGGPVRPRELFPDGLGAALDLPPVSGGGLVRRTPDGGWAGLIALDLGVLQLQAVALLRAPTGTAPTSFLVLLSARFPPPGIQVGLGFALDAIGGQVGVNRRVDATALRQLVSDGNADRVLFPDQPAERAAEIVQSLVAVYPVAPGRFLIGPMVRLNWGGRMVSLSGALVLELPAPVRAVLIGRLLVAVPDPAVPLIRLQAGVLGRLDPSVPEFELLVSLAGSWIVGLAVRGELYLLIRGGAQPEFVLSAGGFHPRYARPARVPALRRLQVDLAPGNGFGLRMEAYLAITSNAAMFGGQVQLDATIAGCGVTGWLGLDALFVFDPVFLFSVHVRGGVAVRAFGHRLAGVALDFTLVGPAPWRAYGTGSISVLFWDVDLDFDVHWGAPPAALPEPGRDPLVPLREAVARPGSWVAERPSADRTALVLSPAATGELAEGLLVHPDATLRFSQRVVPLGIAVSRFERRPVPTQTWTLASVTLGGTAKDAGHLPPVPERFVPGDFFDLDEERQLTAPALAEYAGGVLVPVEGTALGPGHRVDDGYETAYEPPLRPKEFTRWPGHFGHEAVFSLNPGERLARWRAPEPLVRVRPPTLNLVTAGTLLPRLADVSLVNASADAWEALRDRAPGPQAPVELVESWELPS
ncbi:hypothetical protein WN71_017950 [Streptomyces mangrovisoli]|uniref:DUF6603 domain-containing protein n=1 Tax=Streptomyces mangrovisoli TaxID=1428628 RepID=A0A1J4NWC8_9ACTN|nr:hypothetical protein WN71_017950 [Streptomyces mangrovisoli]